MDELSLDASSGALEAAILLGELQEAEGNLMFLQVSPLNPNLNPMPCTTSARRCAVALFVSGRKKAVALHN